MKGSKKIVHFGTLSMDWRRLLIQGVFILVMGILMALASIANPDTLILSARGFSWLPVSGMFLFLLGVVGCLEAFFAKEQREVVQNLHVGVMEMVVGGLIVLSISETVSQLSIMIAAFLLIKGIVRIVLVNKLKLPHKFSTVIGGVVSLFLGVLVLTEWPTGEGWFVSLCLNIEISFRGWSVISFALWVKKQQINASE